MRMPPSSRNFIHRFVYRFASSATGATVFSMLAPPLDRILIKFTSGKISASKLFSGVAVYTLTSVGAKSGKKRETTLFGVTVGNKVVLIASNWGKANHANWYYNLKANPQASLAFNGKAKQYRAHEALGKEREDYWAHMTSVYDIYENYVDRAKGRVLPVMVMIPVEVESENI